MRAVHRLFTEPLVEIQSDGGWKAVSSGTPLGEVKRGRASYISRP